MNKNLRIGLIVVLVAVLGFIGYRTIFGAKKVVVDSSAQGVKIAEYANPEAFITPLQLNELVDSDEDVVIIGALNPTKGDTPIKGSFTMWRSDYSASEGDYPFAGMRNTPEEMDKILSSYGVTKDSIIVVYAANSHHDASRLKWQIENLAGHKDVRYLDGGLNAWISAGYETSSDTPNVTATDYKGNHSTKYLATLEMVQEAIDNPDEWLIIDTRSAGEESGESTKKGAFGPGKIPGSLWIEWTNAVDSENTTLKTLAELEEIYKAAEGKKVIAFCQSGVRSAHTFLVLRDVLGMKDVYNYDGSWIEWSYEHYEKGSVEVENGQ